MDYFTYTYTRTHTNDSLQCWLHFIKKIILCKLYACLTSKSLVSAVNVRDVTESFISHSAQTNRTYKDRRFCSKTVAEGCDLNRKACDFCSHKLAFHFWPHCSLYIFPYTIHTNLTIFPSVMRRSVASTPFYMHFSLSPIHAVMLVNYWWRQ